MVRPVSLFRGVGVVDAVVSDAFMGGGVAGAEWRALWVLSSPTRAVSART